MIRFLSFIAFLMPLIGIAQVDFTANDNIKPYTGKSMFGTNMGYHPGWQDEQLADICAGNPEHKVEGIGAQCLRPALFEHFLDYWGYDVRQSTFEHYKSLGMKDHTVFVGFPAKQHRETAVYCEGQPSEHFANMYEPIWDNGEHGTPVNDKNYYALYLYKLIDRYGEYIRFYEIWNEPDFDYTGKSELPSGKAGSWWDNDPEPCDYKMKAPVTHYIRLLRISYEVIKTLDPDGYVAIGGLGYPSFADAVCRNTDNPVDGSVTAEYPLHGGAYFEVLSYHSYPHIDGSLRNWDNSIMGFRHRRHSDEAVKGVLKKFMDFKTTLFKHGYDDKKYPEKLFIITECNIPRKQFKDFIGSDEAQRNFIMKTVLECFKNKIHQFHVYNLGESATYDNVSAEFQMMGMYQKIENIEPYTQVVNEAGIAYKTMSDLIGNATYDPKRTFDMALPTGINGAAFLNEDGSEIFALWAVTNKDQSEEAYGLYNFPPEFKIKSLELKKWDHSKTNKITRVSSKDIVLNGTPVFLRKKY